MTNKLIAMKYICPKCKAFPISFKECRRIVDGTETCCDSCQEMAEAIALERKDTQEKIAAWIERPHVVIGRYSLAEGIRGGDYLSDED